jgi:hypothetical protein
MQNLTLLPYNLPGKIYRAPMPFGKYDFGRTTLQEMQNLGIHRVVTLTQKSEWHEKAGCNLPEMYRLSGIRMDLIPVADFGAPQDLASYRLGILRALGYAKNCENIAVHCNAGLGRTGTFLAVLAMEVFGWPALDAVFWVRQFIPGAIENAVQFGFVLAWEPSQG